MLVGGICSLAGVVNPCFSVNQSSGYIAAKVRHHPALLVPCLDKLPKLFFIMFQVEGTVPSVVLDAGSHTVKAGLSGEDLPHVLLPSHVSCPSSFAAEIQLKSVRDCRTYAGIDLSDLYTKRPRGNTDVLSPFDCNGLVDSWVQFEALVDHTLHAGLHVETSEHAILYSEPNHNTRAARERLVELFFESFDAPAAYLAKSAVLAAYASGRTTGVVLDIGHSGVSAAPVLEGVLVKDTLLRSNVGGATVSAALKNQLASSGHQVKPLWSFRRAGSHRNREGEGGLAIEAVLYPDVTKSHEQFAVSRLLEEVKAGLCRVHDNQRGTQVRAFVAETEWELPDGNVVRMGSERFEAAECTLLGRLPHVESGPEIESRISFVQQLVRKEGAAVDFPSGSMAKYSVGVDGLVLDAVRMCDSSTHRDMYAGVCLTGGTSDLNGLYERISTGLAETYHKVRVLAATGSMERKYCSWTGGSILGTFSEFQKQWMSRTDYDEAGASLVHRRT